ncbi:MAG TPA: peptidoglycan -binding protein [Stellaceae bacterium]|jgi:chemotaxis protein MotB|nr:peptidoglycan -binding protein [Stellaceae bacterium]
MALVPRSSRRSSIDIWPGFVDALSQLLMVIIFILLVFTAGQFYLGAALSGRDQALQKLQHQVDELANLLSLERQTSEQLRSGNLALSSQLKSAFAERDRLKAELEAKSAALAQQQETAAAHSKELEARAVSAEQALSAEKEISRQALARVDELNNQIATLRDQLARIAAALDASEAKVKEQHGQIVELGKRLNLALVNKVEELARYRSEFFGRLREILGDRPDIRIVGDRFVFQSEVLFAPGSAELGDDAKKQLAQVIGALKAVSAKIPPDINWILQIDGHTDRRPISTPQFPSNWELSTARAMSVVRFAIEQGIPPARLAAAGFADQQPLDPGNTDDAYRRNRRIELKLTER